MNNYGICPKNHEIIQSIFKKFPQIEEVLLFGSRAMNTFKASSDIDFCVKGKNLSPIIGELIAEFEDSNLTFHVDIISYERVISQELLKHIQNHGKIYYQKKESQTK